jgi:hypothetical protein
MVSSNKTTNERRTSSTSFSGREECKLQKLQEPKAVLQSITKIHINKKMPLS